jgi:predicted DNA-binding helix-hairpin-helix protein
MRFYDFDATELTSAEQPDLPLDIDPKLAWALRHRAFFPVDINRAPREALLRIPGLGVRNVSRILRIRRFHKIALDDLQRLKVSLKKVRPFIVTNDHNPEALRIDRTDLATHVATANVQLELFSAATSALSGEV